MEQLITLLANAGGMGLFGAAMLILHRDALKTFREEMDAERKEGAKDRQVCHDEHAMLMVAQEKMGKALEDMTDTLDRLVQRVKP